jgi:hypothetical protein
MAFARKVDATHGAIREALREAGVIVFDTSGTNHTNGGRGAPDLVCYFKGRWTPLWVKRPKGHLTDSEQRLIAKGVPIPFVESVEQALGKIVTCR